MKDDFLTFMVRSLRFDLASSVTGSLLPWCAGFALMGCSPTTKLSKATPEAKRSLAATRPNVVGNYYFGDGLGVNCRLSLSDKQRFEFEWHGCLGVYDQNEGTYSWENDTLVLHPMRLNWRDGLEGTATRFYPVSWGDRFYLIADEKMLEFCHRYAKGWRGREFLGRSADYYLRYLSSHHGIESLKNEVPSRPVVPSLFQSAINGGFQAKIVRQLDESTVLVDKGTEDGLVLKSILCSSTRDRFMVIKLGSHSATCERWSKSDKLPKVGSTLSPG